MEFMEIKDLEYLAKGKRSKVYTGKLKGKKVSVKVSSRAEIEGKWLKVLNKKKIGPKLINVKADLLIYEFVEGERIGEYLKRRNIKTIVRKVLNQCRTLDKLKIDKKELTNPYKHILVEKDKVVMIDFERCHKVNKAQNVTQFCEYLMRKKIVKRKELTPLLKRYKEKQTEENFKEILELVY
jgi:putative serine/threonine protein kinase